MPSLDEEKELQNYLDEVTQATRESLIAWRTANPTTYMWEKEGSPAARLSLQQLERNVVVTEEGRRSLRKKQYYLFQVFEISAQGPNLRLSFDGDERTTLNDKLHALFELIRTEKLLRDLQFLKSTLPERRS